MNALEGLLEVVGPSRKGRNAGDYTPATFRALGAPYSSRPQQQGPLSDAGFRIPHVDRIARVPSAPRQKPLAVPDPYPDRRKNRVAPSKPHSSRVEAPASCGVQEENGFLDHPGRIQNPSEFLEPTDPL